MDSSEDIAAINDGARQKESAEQGDSHETARIVNEITNIPATERLSTRNDDNEIVRILDTAVPIVGPAVPHHFDEMSDAETATRDDASAPAKPRALGFDVEAINQDYALVLAGAKAVVVKEQPSGPIEDRVRMISLEAFNAWFANCPTEYLAPDGQSIRTTTWAKAWLAHRQRRQYVSIEFHPNPDGALLAGRRSAVRDRPVQCAHGLLFALASR